MNSANGMPVVVLISGNGSNLQALIDEQASGELPIRILRVISNRENAFGLERARLAGIDTCTVKPSEHASRDDYDAALREAIDAVNPSLVVLAGFMRILSPEFVRHFYGRIFNIHPSLLPKYRGLNPHKHVLKNGDTVHGASVHFVTEELDGGPVIVQGEVPVLPGDDEPLLAARVQSLEHVIYPQAVKLFAKGRLHMNGDTVMLDGQPLTKPLPPETAGE